ncbi:hypothetical protein FKM82_015872 [Ascaphus truei]
MCVFTFSTHLSQRIFPECVVPHSFDTLKDVKSVLNHMVVSDPEDVPKATLSDCSPHLSVRMCPSCHFEKRKKSPLHAHYGTLKQGLGTLKFMFFMSLY